MKTWIVLLTFSACISTISAQDEFPAAWIGTYAGDLYMEYPGGIRDTVPVTFDFLPTAAPGRWTYKVAYFSKKRGTLIKDYELFQPDSLKNSRHYILDEKDGILIDEILMNGQLMASFEVDHNLFISTLQKTATGLYMEIRCIAPGKGISSTSVPDDKGQAYTVNSGLAYTIQYTHLQRTPKK